MLFWTSIRYHGSIEAIRGVTRMFQSRHKALTVIVLLGLGLTASSRIAAETATADCNTGGAVGPTLARLKPGDVLLVQGTCRENILIQAGLNDITLDGQGKASIHAPDTRQPAIQVLGREVTIKGLIVIGGQ